MAFTENLDQFFDTAGHAVVATFKTAAGDIIRTARVIFTDATGNVGLFEGSQVEAPQPFFQCKTSDLAGIDHSSRVLIGSTTYRITNDLHDGTGTSIVLLKK